MSAVHRSVGSLDWSGPPSRASYEDPIAHGVKRWNYTNTSFTTGLPTPPGSKAMPGLALGNGYAGFPSQSTQQERSFLQDEMNAARQHRESSVASNGSAYSLIPTSNGANLYNRRTSEQNVNAIAPHLQIPESVNKSKGSLAEFTAEITCLFWFETATTLQYAEDLPVDSPADRGLLQDAVPTIGFRKWVTTIISTTQVGKNVILLALMFIYRLKRFNPTVSGKRGSEFRLLTIALMLGNKFLDDNTYTNKTWAEVSGISVTEIHIMEVEFLSNMRYDLYASAAEWSEWKAKLGRFGAFYDKALQMPYTDEGRSNAPTSPTSQNSSHKLPSPPSVHHSSVPFATSAGANGHYPTLPHPLPNAQLPSSPLRRQYGLNAHREPRKRSLDFAVDLPPAKRSHYSEASGSINSFPFTPNTLRVSPTRTNNPTDSETPTSFGIPRMDVPRIPTSAVHTSNQLAPLSVPGNRAMSSVYPNTTTSYSQPVTPMSAIPQNLFQNPIPNLGEGPRSISTYPSAHASPSNNFSTTTPTLPGLSPSYFLTHRTSPYRPVRHVNTLLIPPPPTALQAPVRNVPFDQIHYQPLSKVTSDRRTGPLPFMQAEGWQHSSASTPVVPPHYQF